MKRFPLKLKKTTIANLNEEALSKVLGGEESCLCSPGCGTPPTDCWCTMTCLTHCGQLTCQLHCTGYPCKDPY